MPIPRLKCPMHFPFLQCANYTKRLLSTLSNEGIFLPSACGGGGTCIQCTCQVNSGGGAILPTEEPHFSRKEIVDNYRLSCQVKVREDMEIYIPEESLKQQLIRDRIFIK